MQIEFFTLGGSQFWEDVFFYQKWRIQRNYDSKEYRLLDPWDIRRHSGTFEECRQAFLKYIEIYELSRQRGHMIIMLHGLGDSKNIFKPLWRAALQEGYMAAAINYPSTRKRIHGHVRQLEFLLNNLEDVQEVSFVTKGVGGIVLRKLMSFDSPWQHNLKINRIVQVCPPNQGSRLFKKMAKFRLFKWIFGPMLHEMSPEEVMHIPNFANNIEVGIISSDYPFKGIGNLMPKPIKNILPQPNEAELDKAKETIYISNTKLNIFENQKIVNACINFLKKGRFN